MSDPFRVQQLVAVLRSADAESVRIYGARRPDIDRVTVQDLCDGIDPRVADALAFAARVPEVFDAICEIVNKDNLRAQVKGGAS